MHGSSLVAVMVCSRPQEALLQRKAHVRWLTEQLQLSRPTRAGRTRSRCIAKFEV